MKTLHSRPKITLVKPFHLMALFLLSCFFSRTVYAQEPARGMYFIVRHAEKDTGADPVLTAAGRTRAGELYRLLRQKNIRRIYTTKYHRSIMTGDSLRIYQKTDTSIYQADTTGAGFLQSLLTHQEPGNHVLVIAHSNTIIPLIKSLGYTGPLPQMIPDTEYDQMYIVEKKKKRTTLRIFSYGQASAGTNNAMHP